MSDFFEPTGDTRDLYQEWWVEQEAWEWEQKSDRQDEHPDGWLTERARQRRIAERWAA